MNPNYQPVIDPQLSNTPQLPVQANYYKPGFPVLAFLYALYCDGKAERPPGAAAEPLTNDNYSNVEFKLWRDSGGVHENPNEDYRGYLDSYVTGERPFPERAEYLSAIAVPRRGTAHVVRLEGETSDSIRYVPALETALEMAPHVIAEVTNTPAQDGRRREPLSRWTEAREAALSGAAPLLSTLAVMFLKGDRSVWDHYAQEKGFSPDVLDVLSKFSRNEAVSFEQAGVLIDPLARELSAEPPVW
ncbi:MAG TPA: hypothetical protein VNN80_23410 [Polyangiaceae bacterium]|jgi:hypothetical protein|nr:hypothetical protein [Polyangiaceae bacterium]